MPNYVINRLEIYGVETATNSDGNITHIVRSPTNELVYKIFDTVLDDRREFDFNKIIPRPDDIINSFNSTAVDRGLRYWLKHNEGDELWDKISKMVYARNDEETYSNEDILLGQKAVNNIRRYGYKDWYDWNRACWGTKRNAAETRIIDNVIMFKTAWNSPKPVIKRLSEMFPEAIFEFEYADEDIGSNCGSLEYMNGNLIQDRQLDDSEAKDFAMTLWDMTEENEDA